MNLKKILLTAALMPLGVAFADQTQWIVVEKGPEESSIRLAGHVIPKDGALSIESARVQGRIISILKREGEAVKAGEPLFALNSPECISLQQELGLAANRGLTDLVEASSKREEQLALSMENGQCRMLATHSGILTKRQVELGATFNAGDALATIIDPNNLTVELEASEEDIGQIQPGQEAKIHFESGGKISSGHVLSVVPAIDPLTRTARVRLTSVNVPAGLSIDSMAWGQICMRGQKTALRVPSAAVIFDSGKRYVIKKSAPHPIAVLVHVLGESDNYSLVQPVTPAALTTNDEIALRGAVFLMNEIKEQGPAL